MVQIVAVSIALLVGLHKGILFVGALRHNIPAHAYGYSMVGRIRGETPVQGANARDSLAGRTDTLRVFLQEVGIEVITDISALPASPSGFTAVQATATNLAAYAEVLRGEIALYPVEVLKRIKLDRIVLCADLVIEGDRVGGYAHVAAATLYLDVGGDMFVLWQRKTVHHELFHFIDDAEPSAKSTS